MSLIVVKLTPEDAHNNLVLIDLALKHPDGGIKVMKAAIAITDKINAAVAEAQNRLNDKCTVERVPEAVTADGRTASNPEAD